MLRRVLVARIGSEAAFWLGLEASVVSTLVAVVTLYAETFSRVRVSVREDFLVESGGQGGGYLVHGDDTLATMGIPVANAIPVLSVAIYNRGRHTVQITAVSRATVKGGEVFADLLKQLPLELPAGHSATLVNGREGGYAHGDLPLRRFYIVDGATRIYPYRERWRLRVEKVLYRGALTWWNERRRRLRARQR